MDSSKFFFAKYSPSILKYNSWTIYAIKTTLQDITFKVFNIQSYISASFLRNVRNHGPKD